jgi:hypothetical protein
MVIYMYEEYQCEELEVLAKNKKGTSKAKVCNVFQDKGCCTGEDDECC